MGRNNRNESVAVEEAPAEVQGDTSTSEAIAAAQAPKRTRNPVDVGTVTIGESQREIRSSRPSKMDTNEVALAVKNAEQGKRYEIAFEEGKADAIVSVLRRAGGYYQRGISILAVVDEAAEYAEDGETVVTPAERVVVFSVGERRVRKPKPAEGETSTEDTPAEPEAATE